MSSQGAPISREGITLATRVTILRILGIPLFVLLLVYYTLGLAAGRSGDLLRWAALWLFVVVALTDALDGYLARSRNEVTRLGRFLDPLADKALLISGLVLLTRPSLPGLEPHIPVWFTTAVISRDVVLAAGYFVIHHFAGQVHVQPRWTGKLATVLQMATILWVLMQAAPRHFGWLVAAAALLTFISGTQYVLDGVRQLEHRRP